MTFERTAQDRCVRYTATLAGGERFEFDTLCQALIAVRSLWPKAFFHGDGSRVLAWENEAESVDDDGRRAIAQIRPLTAFAERVHHYADTLARGEVQP